MNIETLGFGRSHTTPLFTILFSPGNFNQPFSSGDCNRKCLYAVGDEQLFAADDGDLEGGASAGHPAGPAGGNNQDILPACQTRFRSASTITAIAGESCRRLG
jgi:hypothetical protein